MMSGESEASVKRRQQMADEQPLMQQQEVAPGQAAEEESGLLSPRWRKWFIRGIFSFILIGSFSVIIYLGPVCLSLLVIVILIKCFQEIISIGYSKYKEYNLPLYRVLNWYFLLVATYFIYLDNLRKYYLTDTTGLLGTLTKYHHIISFFLYVGGFVLFVLTLKKGFYQIQFGMFAWSHLTAFMLGSQAYLILQNIFEGFFWFLLPVSMVVCNDIMAYLFGFFFGRTSLIKLSPKKTWEGFIGAFVSTVIFGFIFAYVLAKYDYFVCYNEVSDCERTHLFTLQEYHFLGLPIHLYPAQLHSLPLSIFASLIAPFGGFFASGFKRAFNVKDFADLIPGHGGIMDRFDCQMLMATFANVYYFSFCRSPNPDKLVTMFAALTSEQQVHVMKRLKDLLRQ